MITLPDGRKFATAPHRALRARFESSVVFATNSFDDRPVTIRIAHADASGAVVEVGTVTVRMMELLNGREIALSDRAVVELRVVAEGSPQADGSLEGFATFPPPAPPLAAPVGPAPRR